jgi:hypothetical protein
MGDIKLFRVGPSGVGELLGQSVSVEKSLRNAKLVSGPHGPEI